MPFRSSKPSSDDSSGLKEEMSSFARGAGSYLQARAELLALEGKDAGISIGKRLARYLAAFACLVIFYFLLLGASIGLLGSFLAHHGNGILFGWVGATLIIATMHLIIGLILWVGAKKASAESYFPYTRSEWQKDQEWLNQKAQSEKKN